MKQTISFCQFIDAFNDAGRENQFTYEGKKALYEYIERLDEDCGTEAELDVIALCCGYTEYNDLEEFHNDYSNEDFATIEEIEEYTQVIHIPNSESFIIAQF